MNFHILTLFPEMVQTTLSESITGRAIKQNLISVNTVNIRDFSQEKHKKVDDYTYGGGAGMLMQAQPVYDAWESVTSGKKIRTVYVTPQGPAFNQTMAEDFSKEKELIILCGHYEGIDERVLEEVVTDYVSIGDYVLTGGELAAMVMVDAISRLVPGVLHNDVSAETESFHGNLLEYPQYSRPEVWHDKPVPAVLLSGNQKEINKWRLEQSINRTRERRPDLYEEYDKLQKCKDVLMSDKMTHMDMIELINRGMVELLHFDDKEILLKEKTTGIYLHSLTKQGSAESTYLVSCNCLVDLNVLIVHQSEMIPVVESELGMHVSKKAKQYVLTRKEKLPVKGLYRPDGQPLDNGFVIRALDENYTEDVVRSYGSVGGDTYIRRMVAEQKVVGAFSGDTLWGYGITHADGSVGYVFVFPEYRRKHVGMAIETYMLNAELEKGNTPFCRVKCDNTAAMDLQIKLGLYESKGTLFWID